MSATQLQDALEASAVPAAQLAAGMLRSGEARASTRTVSYGELFVTLRVRRDIKRDQAESLEPNVVALRDALEAVVSWWEANPEEALFYDNITTDSAVSFVFWRRVSDGVVLAGFESRDARKLTEDDGKAFWGPNWRPPYSGI
jgi:hypothetical protein